MLCHLKIILRMEYGVLGLLGKSAMFPVDLETSLAAAHAPIPHPAMEHPVMARHWSCKTVVNHVVSRPFSSKLNAINVAENHPEIVFAYLLFNNDSLFWQQHLIP